MKNVIVFIIIMCFTICDATAQFDQNIEFITIYSKDGKVIKGIFKEMTPTEITYFLDGKNQTILRSDIRKFNLGNVVEEGKSIKKKRNSYSDQYLFFQSALPIPTGQFTFKNYNVFVNQFSYGISEKFSLSAGFETISLFVAESFPVVYVTPKFSTGNDNLHFSISSTLFFSDGEYAGIINANTTLGDRKNNLTFGISIPYSDEDIDNDHFININGMVSAHEKLAFIADAVIYSEFGFIIFGGGIRYTGDNNISIDLALVRIDDLDFGLPFLGLTFPLSN